MAIKRALPLTPLRPLKYAAAVFIGRFQPLHLGHVKVIEHGLAIADSVIVCIGGAGGARRPRNPWTWQDRAEMIGAVFPAGKRVFCVPIPDHTYSEAAWLEAVQAQVRGAAGYSTTAREICLIGRSKDRSSYYLNLFPQWASEAVPDHKALDATAIRNRLFATGELPGLDEVPRPVLEWLTGYMGTPEARKMREWYANVSAYKTRHDSGEYHRNNVCADAVVTQAGHVLLIRRKAHPGKGMLALPGGHIERDELAFDACIRELKEETGIKVPDPVLRGSVVANRVFDDPFRSDLCRTYSHAWWIDLKHEGSKLAKLRAGTDAESAMWVPLADLHEDELFDDHYHLIRALTGTNK